MQVTLKPFFEVGKLVLTDNKAGTSGQIIRLYFNKDSREFMYVIKPVGANADPKARIRMTEKMLVLNQTRITRNKYNALRASEEGIVREESDKLNEEELAGPPPKPLKFRTLKTIKWPGQKKRR